jgi:hypothetical protein
MTARSNVNRFSETKRKILATLGNFAYDPINYGWLYQVGAAELFIGKNEKWNRTRH